MGITVGALWLVVGIAYGVEYLISPWLGARALSSVEPRINAVPVSLTRQAQVPLSNASVDAFGFKIQLPNREIEKTRKTERFTFISFRDGGWLLVEDMSPYPGADSIPSLVEFDKRAEQLLGQELAHSEFKRMQAAMLTTPDQVKWWRFRSSRNMRASFLLGEKLFDLMECKQPLGPLGPIYAVSFGQFHGFQCGDPDVAPYDARIDLFDDSNRQIKLEIAGPQGHGPVLTQEELNAIVASIRPSPDR